MKKVGGCLAVWVCVSLGSASTAWAADERSASAVSKPSLTVTVTTPQASSLAQKISANGNLAAWQEAIVGAEANGLKITEVRVNVGDRVQRGDVLATLQADTLQAELAQAQAALAEDPDQSAIRDITLSLDVAQVHRTEQPFARLRDVGAALCEAMDGVLCDQNGQPLPAMAMDPIAADLELLYDQLDGRDLSAGSVLARRLFS